MQVVHRIKCFRHRSDKIVGMFLVGSILQKKYLVIIKQI